jgi:hypothetical protein
VIAKVVLQVVLVLGHERALGAGEQLLRLDVTFAVLPEVLLSDGDELALLALERLDFALGVDPRHPDALLVLQLLRGQVVFLLEVGSVVCLDLGHVVALDAPGSVFTTLYFLCNLRVGLISYFNP